MVYQGRELSEYNSEFLAQQAGMLSGVKKIFLGILIIGAVMSFYAGLVNESFLVGIALAAFCFAICIGPILYAHKKSEGMLAELDRRNPKKKAETEFRVKKAEKFQFILTIAGILLLALLFLGIVLV